MGGPSQHANLPFLGVSSSKSGSGNVEDGVSDKGLGVVAQALSRFHSGLDFGNNGMVEFPINGVNNQFTSHSRGNF